MIEIDVLLPWLIGTIHVRVFDRKRASTLRGESGAFGLVMASDVIISPQLDVCFSVHAFNTLEEVSTPRFAHSRLRACGGILILFPVVTQIAARRNNDNDFSFRCRLA